jgi:hypothetical protein
MQIFMQVLLEKMVKAKSDDGSVQTVKAVNMKEVVICVIAEAWDEIRLTYLS